MTVLISLITRSTIHAEVVKWLLKQPDKYGIDISNSPLPLEHARNQQVERFLGSPFDYLYLLDSDCVPVNNVLESMLALDLLFVAAPHPTIKGNETGVMVLDRIGKDEYVQHKPWDKGLQECDAVGCAGMMIHRDVFNKLEKPYFKFIYNNNGELVKGEDFYFCDKMKEAGIKIYAYCDMMGTHYIEVAI